MRTTHRDNLQEPATARVDPLEAAMYVIEERVSLLEDSPPGAIQAGSTATAWRPGQVIGTVLTTVCLLSIVGIVWCLLFDAVDQPAATIGTIIFALLALFGGVIALGGTAVGRE